MPILNLLSSIITPLLHGNEVSNTELVKRINVAVNLAFVALASAAQVGLIHINPGYINQASEFIQSAITNYLPMLLPVIFNIWTTLATSKRIGIGRKNA